MDELEMGKEKIESHVMVQPMIQHFNRLAIMSNDASRVYASLPSRPELMITFIGILRELYRLPRALAWIHDGKDSQQALIEKIDAGFKPITQRAMAEWKSLSYVMQMIDAGQKPKKPYIFPLDFYNELDDLYNDIYQLLAKKGLLMPMENSVAGGVMKSLQKRVSE